MASQSYEYLVVTTDHKSLRIIADSIKGVLDAIDEEQTPILNIFRNVPVSEGSRSEEAVIHTKVIPAVAAETGCYAFPSMPVRTQQGKAITLAVTVPRGWKFSGWYDPDGTVIATEPQSTILVHKAGDVVYEARFYPAV